MFSQASVICPQGGVWQTPPGETPPGQTPPWADTPLRQTPQADTPPGRHLPGRHPRADGYCNGWYASYWNAFLLVMGTLEP